MTNYSNMEADHSSYASILQGVKRMREQFESDDGKEVNAESNLEREFATEADKVNTTSDKHTNNTRSEGDQDGKSQIIESNTNVAPSRSTAFRNSAPVRAATFSRIQVLPSQKGNPLLVDSKLKSTAWEYSSSIVSDYVVNPKLQFLFLSLKYYKLHPEYLWQRIKKMNKGSTNSSILTSDDSLRILLVVVDVDSHQEILRNLLNFCVKQDMSMVLAWSFEEAGNYIYHAKKQELSATRQNTSIKRAREEDYESRIRDTLVSIRAVNKTDLVNLLGNYKSFKNIVQESSLGGDGLSKVHGLGTRKIENMRQIFLEPFIYNKEYVIQ